MVCHRRPAVVQMSVVPITIADWLYRSLRVWRRRITTGEFPALFMSLQPTRFSPGAGARNTHWLQTDATIITQLALASRRHGDKLPRHPRYVSTTTTPLTLRAKSTQERAQLRPQPQANTDQLTGPGYLFTVNPQVVNEQGTLDVFCQNRRSVMGIERPNGRRVAVVAVGAMLVGSIKYMPGVQKQGAKVKRGDCLGAFYYGGSTVITLYEPGGGFLCLCIA